MNQNEEAFPGIKVVVLSAGGAALVALLVALAKREKKPEVQQRVEDVSSEVEKRAKKAAKAAKKQQKKLEKEAAIAKQRISERAQQTYDLAAARAVDAERDLKAAAWDAQQEAKAAESRLRAARQRVAEDAAHLASRVGSEAKHLAGEGKDRLALLRNREEVARGADAEIARLRAELETLKGAAKSQGRQSRLIAERLGSLGAKNARNGAIQGIAADAATAALAQAERSLRVKAPALLAARSRAEAIDILQKELGPTVREAAAYAATAALASWQASRQRSAEIRDETPSYGDDAVSVAKNFVAGASDATAHTGEDAREDLREAVATAEAEAAEAREQAEAAEQRVESLATEGKKRFWRSASSTAADMEDIKAATAASDVVEEAAAEPDEEIHRSKAGLFWGGAGLGLALYALLDAERRDKVLQFANEASVQIQELVRDMQGYDDEF
ncbi:MAG: hypothetical protein U0031_14720 [Thermomicrobiales bacterium]